MSSSKWGVFEGSKKNVLRAGKVLRNPSADPADRAAALTVAEAWRRAHAYPMNTWQVRMRRYTTVELTRAAHQLHGQIEDGTRYARAGLMLTDLLPAGVHLPLEPFRQPHENAGIAALVDGVQKKAGKDALGLGYGGFRPDPAWQMKRSMLTPRATTHWNELARVRA